MTGMGYSMHIQPQKTDGKEAKERIDNMGVIVEKNLKDYHRKNARFPVKLLMFRDGVSEGFFDEVRITRNSYKKIADFRLNVN
jgi:hypothetical protein